MSVELEIAAQPAAGVDDLKRIGELLSRDAPEQPEPGPEDEPEVTDPPPAPEMDEGEPEPVAVDPPDVPPEVDYDQVIPMPDGAKSLTLGQLKDHYQTTADFAEQRESWEDTRQDQQAESIAQKQVLYDMAALIGDANPALVEHVQQQRLATRQVENKRLIEVYPEWADPEVKKAQIPRLLRAAKHLGFSEAEFAVSGDHRQIRALEIIARDLERKDKAAAAVEALKPTLPKGQKPSGRKQTDSQKKRDVIKRGKDGTPDEKRAAISALLG